MVDYKWLFWLQRQGHVTSFFHHYLLFFLFCIVLNSLSQSLNHLSFLHIYFQYLITSHDVHILSHPNLSKVGWEYGWDMGDFFRSWQIMNKRKYKKNLFSPFPSFLGIGYLYLKTIDNGWKKERIMNLFDL